MSQADRERWDQRWGEGGHSDGDPPDWLADLEAELPRAGRALDVAAGSGRAALWLARRGLTTLAVDVSPVGLKRLEASAVQQGLHIEARVRDLEREPLPVGPFDVVACLRYLQRDLFPALRDCLNPRGLLVCELVTRRNLERHDHPSERFLVEENELLELVVPLRVVYYREGWIDGRAVARVAAVRQPV